MQTADFHTMAADSVRCESSGDPRKALSVKACKPWVNTNTAIKMTQHNSERIRKCLLN